MDGPARALVTVGGPELSEGLGAVEGVARERVAVEHLPDGVPERNGSEARRCSEDPVQRRRWRGRRRRRPRRPRR
eukprot:15472025-Alexandrium_andersonii.AAC.1